MTEGEVCGLVEADLVMFTIPGVQRYITESRTTADLVSASTQVEALALVAVRSLERGGGQVVVPAPTGARGVPPVSGQDVEDDQAYAGAPNRVMALVAPGAAGRRGAALAAEAADAVHREWRRWQAATFPAASGSPEGFPDPQWVCVPPAPGGYAEQFRTAQQALTARRRVKSFPQVLHPRDGVRSVQVCSVSARWPAEPKPPRGARPHEEKESLSLVNWVKRLAPHRDRRPGTPSTFSIASAPYRAEVLRLIAGRDDRTRERVGRALVNLWRAGVDLRGGETSVHGLNVPQGLPRDVDAAARWLVRSGGPWVDPERWRDTSLREVDRETAQGDVDVSAGRRAARVLAAAVERGPGTHLAVVLQDLDSLGLFLGGKVALRNGTSFEVEPDSHARVSALLARVAGDQVAVATRVSDPLFGVPVYAGGDDVLMLAPAATAMRLARAIHDAIPADALPTASTAVFYFSQQGSLQQAIGRAHDLLKQAKALPDKHGLAVGYERRTGTTHHTVQPWDSPRGAGLGKVLAALSAEGAGSAQVSPRLVFDLQRDGDALASLAGAHESLLRAEMRRLVARHRRRSDNVVDVAPEEGQVATVESSTDHAFADLLVDLGLEEAEVTGKFDPVPAARVGLFLRQEAR